MSNSITLITVFSEGTGANQVSLDLDLPSNIEHVLAYVEPLQPNQNLDNQQKFVSAVSYSKAINQAVELVESDLVVICDACLNLDSKILEQLTSKLGNSSVLVGLQGELDTDLKTINCSWFEILKYWIPGTLPLLLACKANLLKPYAISKAALLDDSLSLAGLYDLVVRMTAKEDFEVLELPRRQLEEVKSLIATSEYSAEGSRVFNRAFFQNYVAERSITFVIPLNDESQDLRDTFESILRQSQRNFEVVLLDNYSSDRSSSTIAKSLEGFKRNWPQLPVRFVKGSGSDVLSILRDASAAAAAPLISIIHSGVKLADDFCVHTEAVFMADSIAFSFPLRNSSAAERLLCKSVHQVQVFNLESVFSAQALPRCFVVRKLAYLDTEQPAPCINTVAGLRDVLIRLMGKGWLISDGLELEIQDNQQFDVPAPHELKIWGTCLTAQLIVDIAIEQEQYALAKRRAQRGMGLAFDDEVVEAAKGFLLDVPPQWWQYQNTTDTSVLTNVLERYPQFTPGWDRLAKTYEAEGDLAAASNAREKMAQVSKGLD